MIKKIFFWGLVAGAVVLGAESPAIGAELRDIALSADADSAQLTLDLTDVAPQRLFTLEHPDRVVVDLPDTHRAGGVHAPAPSGVVTEVRFGVQPHGTLRVVVQLRSALPVHSAWAVGGEGRHLVLILGQPVVAAATPEAGPKAVRATHAPGDGDRDVIIAVDAGHGGVDPGAIGHGGTREKDVTLAIARALAQRIDAQPGMRAVLTRDRDEFLELRDRIARARAAHADMFVSIHADSIADRSVTGASVYVLSVRGASSEAARVLADRENSADLLAGVPLDEQGTMAVVLDATQSEIIGLSAGAAEQVVSALEGVGELRKAQVQRAGFVVLKSPAIPSMLIETAYISNPAEERRLRSSAQQERLAEAIAGGVRSYFVQNPPDGTRFKQEHRGTLVSAAEGASGTAAR
jgi:N-acetylmuramoyl-L-alanine amidase